MKLHLRRSIFNQDETLGELYVNDAYCCDTLEDRVRETKIQGVTAIPAGEYAVVVTRSPRFHRLLPLICDVPNFSGIRIHRGNTHEDTAGCILVGKKNGYHKLEDSTATEVYLTNMLLRAQQRGEEITILVE